MQHLDGFGVCWFFFPLETILQCFCNMLQLFLNVPVMYGWAFYLKMLFETSVDRKQG